ncbi:MAG: hypothetical protein AB7M93_30810, partial [Candidatus Obscuribacterales bacterium]
VPTDHLLEHTVSCPFPLQPAKLKKHKGMTLETSTVILIDYTPQLASASPACRVMAMEITAGSFWSSGCEFATH